MGFTPSPSKLYGSVSENEKSTISHSSSETLIIRLAKPNQIQAIFVCVDGEDQMLFYSSDSQTWLHIKITWEL